MSSPLEMTTDLLRIAYSNGYFPMPEQDSGQIMWLSPDPRAIFPLDGFHVSRSLARTLKKVPFTYSINKAFMDVMEGCGDRKDTWINQQFKDTYHALHKEGDAHSIEVWLGEKLVGGLYGVSFKGAFFAESMFHRETGASKAAIHYLITYMKTRQMRLLEVQFLTPHLVSLGAIAIPRKQYLIKLKQALSAPTSFLDGVV
jgi:leucyl/phenylalanyl-tRNA--protein transferase